MQPEPHPAAVFCEDPCEFDRLLAGLRALHQPSGPVEEFLVEQMACAQWGIRRYRRTLAGLVEYQTALAAGRMGLERKQDTARADPEIERANTLLMGAAFHFDAREDGAQLRLHRILTDLDRQYSRALKNLLAGQSRRAAPRGQEAVPEQSSQAPAEAAAATASAPRVNPAPALANPGPVLLKPGPVLLKPGPQFSRTVSPDFGPPPVIPDGPAALIPELERGTRV